HVVIAHESSVDYARLRGRLGEAVRGRRPSAATATATAPAPLVYRAAVVARARRSRDDRLRARVERGQPGVVRQLDFGSRMNRKHPGKFPRISAVAHLIPEDGLRRRYRTYQS